MLSSNVSRPTTPEPHAPPLTDKYFCIDPPPPVPPLPSWVNVSPNRRLSPSSSTQRNTSGHYIKHSSKLTLLLSGQREGVSTPQYSYGDTIEGILTIARPAGVIALEVKVEGSIQIQEAGGSGSVTVKALDESIYSWNASRNGPFPPNASFCYTLPNTFLDPLSGKHYLLPPSYTEDLQGIPGFSVKISYAIAVNLRLSREASTLWRGMNNIMVPFRYSHRTRPLLAGPFPCNVLTSPARPRTLYKFQMRSWRRSAPNINVELYLPSSAVCFSQDVIPFEVRLFADELTLEPFAEYRPARSSSFLPLARAESRPGAAAAAAETSLQHQLASRKGTRKCPLRIRVQRTTTVDTGSVGLGYAGPARAVRHLFKTEPPSPSSSDGDRSYMYTARALGHGEVHSVRREHKAVVWKGTIVVAQGADGFSEAFAVNGLKVVDSIVLAIDPPPACRSRYLPLNESIALHLTSDPYRSKRGVPVTSMD